MRQLVTVLAVVALSSISIPAQETQPVFRSSTRLIVETVTVTDRAGRSVEDLTADDFLVTEDNVPQQIAFVEFQRLESDGPHALQGLPFVLQGTEPPSGLTQAGISMSAPGDSRYRGRRLLVLYFDASAMSVPDQMRAFTSAMAFINHRMTPLDLVAIVVFQGGAVRVKHDFTDAKGRLREVIQTLIYGDDLDGDGIPDGALEGTAFGQNDAEFNIFSTDRQLAALQTAVEMLRALPERKALVYFSSGLRLNGANNQAQLRATVNAAVRANVSVHPIDARGLVATPPLGDATRPSPGGMEIFTGQPALLMSNVFQRSQDTLDALARDTGGRAMFDHNDLALGISQAASSITSYYILGYYSQNLAADGKFRRVRVSLKVPGTARVGHRQGYFADKTFGRMSASDRERQLEDALLLDNRITDIPAAVEVNYFQLTRAEYFVPVTMKIPGSELMLAKRRGARRAVLDIIGEVKDRYGTTIENIRDRLDIKLDDDVAERLASRPLQYDTGFTLLPDTYVIKLLVRDATTGRIGTYQTGFTVPNLGKEDVHVPISSVVLASQRVPPGEEIHSVKQRIDATGVSPLVHDGQKLIPSVTRVFSRGQDLHVYLEAYQRDADVMRPLTAFVSVYRDNAMMLQTSALSVTSGWKPGSKAVPLRFSIPLAGLLPGDYDCQVTVLDPEHQKVAFWRAPIVMLP